MLLTDSILKVHYYLTGNLATAYINGRHLKAAACKIVFLSNKIGLRK
jgi:hypothetical protein